MKFSNLEVAMYGHAGIDQSVVWMGRCMVTKKWACVWTKRDGSPAGVWSEDIAEPYETCQTLTKSEAHQ